ncbi:hypothetical protein BDV95DRAFT_601289 [Massariosphaeria phaeospora]|uniref:Uncharacterized protein n=1 Tax=Massariosphaeria phaeospora TaxID=100035 RepID=A0A7C8IDD8_9PLEO|nr:hypothetical protein BDV95DRAFT_601289 [Massariosphaeria phaeospora]
MYVCNVTVPSAVPRSAVAHTIWALAKPPYQDARHRSKHVDLHSQAERQVDELFARYWNALLSSDGQSREYGVGWSVIVVEERKGERMWGALPAWVLYGYGLQNQRWPERRQRFGQGHVDAVSASKGWVQRGSEKLKGSNIPLLGKTTKDAMNPSLDKGKYENNVNDVVAKFDKLGELEGPLSQNANAGRRYNDSIAADKFL